MPGVIEFHLNVNFLPNALCNCLSYPYGTIIRSAPSLFDMLSIPLRILPDNTEPQNRTKANTATTRSCPHVLNGFRRIFSKAIRFVVNGLFGLSMFPPFMNAPWTRMFSCATNTLYCRYPPRRPIKRSQALPATCRHDTASQPHHKHRSEPSEPPWPVWPSA